MSNVTVGQASGSAMQFILIDNFPIDVALTEEHDLESDVTDYPTEDGSSISDNVRPRPITVTLECLVSNTPIGHIATRRSASRDLRNLSTLANAFISRNAAASEPNSQVTPAQEAYSKLQEIRDAREPIEIATSLRRYENMLMKGLSIPRAAADGDSLRFTATFQQVEIVKNKREKRVAIPIARGPTTTTKSPTSPANPAKQQFGSTTKVFETGQGMWFDDSIGAWRFSHRIDNRNGRRIYYDGPLKNFVNGSKHFLHTYVSGLSAAERDALKPDFLQGIQTEDQEDMQQWMLTTNAGNRIGVTSAPVVDTYVTDVIPIERGNIDLSGFGPAP